MGAGQSTSQSEVPSHGLHVLRVTPSSPAFHAKIEPFFDFVVGFEGDTISSEEGIDVSALEKIVESHENRTLNLLVWNSKSQQTRVVPLVPSRIWSQQQHSPSDSQSSPSSAQPSLLGLSMRLCQPETASDNVWHVLDVIEGSPAESAGLVPMGDWILGWSGGVLSAENDFYDLVEAHVDKPLRVYVYSYDFEFGLLHRIPPQPEDRVPGSIPPELQAQEDEYGSQQLFVPADVEEHQARGEEHEHWNREVLSREAHIQHASRSQSSSPSIQHGDHIHSVHNHDSNSASSPDISMPRPSSRNHTNPPRIHSPLSPRQNPESSEQFSLR
ncbi:hypothetical protein D9613_006077 [Agrocybe pediades]|uniref:PDZ GRASP-type domain-containing protein n=1 Tax=Agrocybe pediades TaxID=84607 RepID=A0A8H4VRL2_9AGAR|nr:hypothetical protein D9613_006077 [Agrocybe pediades]